MGILERATPDKDHVNSRDDAWLIIQALTYN